MEQQNNNDLTIDQNQPIPTSLPEKSIKINIPGIVLGVISLAILYNVVCSISPGSMEAYGTDSGMIFFTFFVGIIFLVLFIISIILLKKNIFAIILFLVAALIVCSSAYFITGNKANKYKRDAQRLSDMHTIMAYIYNYHLNYEDYPKDISSLNITEPTGKNYDYQKINKDQFKLCPNWEYHHSAGCYNVTFSVGDINQNGEAVGLPM